MKKCASKNTIKALAILSCSLFILVPVLSTEVNGDTQDIIEKNMPISTNDHYIPTDSDAITLYNTSVDSDAITLYNTWSYLCGPYWDEFSFGSFWNSICTADWTAILGSISIVSIMNFMSGSSWISSVKSMLYDTFYEPPIIVTSEPPNEDLYWLDYWLICLCGHINDAMNWILDYMDNLLQKGFWEALYTIISDLSNFILSEFVVPLWNFVFKYIADMSKSIFDFITHSFGIFMFILIVDFIWKVPRIDAYHGITYARTDVLLIKTINLVVNFFGWKEYRIM